MELNLFQRIRFNHVPADEAVWRAEKLLIKGGYSIKLIPTPRQFSSDCDIALRFDWSHREKVKPVLDDAKVEFDSVHFLDTESV